MEENIISNPFVGCTARDMTYEEVRQYWCSPFNLYNISESELFTSRTPIVIEGARGTGKTMILKYLSYSIQKDFIKEKTVTEKLKWYKKKSLGVYFRYKEDFCNMFDGLDCSNYQKTRIFTHYYELFIVRQILGILEDFYCDERDTLGERALCDFWGISNRSIKGVHEYVNELISRTDEIINLSSYNEAWKDEIMPLIKKGNLVSGIIKTINNSFDGWSNILFVILLDEYENLKMFQPIVNTLIKQVDDTVNLTYRLGMRPAGMDNNETNVAGEHLQVDRDFLLRRLEFKKMSEYKKFALDISKRRLESVEIFRDRNLCDINNILGKTEDFDNEANQVVKNGIKHFKIIKAFYTNDELKDVIRELSCDDKLMEMYNVLRVLRGENYKKTGEICRKYRALSKRADALKDIELNKYHQDYSNKYRVTLLYMLLTTYGERKQYYSVNTFLRLSSGSINDYISLCRNVFKHMNEKMFEDLQRGICISNQIQTYASIDTAEDQRRKVFMSNDYGKEMYTFIENMGSIFEEYHRDMEARYPETNQFAFADENEIRNDDILNKYLVELINSGAIIRKQKRQLISVGKTRGYIYQLNRIYAPIYQYSYRTRGGFNQIINRNDFEDMIKKTIDPKKYVGKNRWLGQYDLFGLEDDNE